MCWMKSAECEWRQRHASGLAIVGRPVEAFVEAQLTIVKGGDGVEDVQMVMTHDRRLADGTSRHACRRWRGDEYVSREPHLATLAVVTFEALLSPASPRIEPVEAAVSIPAGSQKDARDPPSCPYTPLTLFGAPARPRLAHLLAPNHARNLTTICPCFF